MFTVSGKNNVMIFLSGLARSLMAMRFVTNSININRK